jgi:chromatin remodeling complex protein RSC6
MARTVKTATKTTEVASAPVIESAPAPAPVVIEAAEKKVKKAKPVKAVVEVQDVAPAVTTISAAVAVDATAATAPEESHVVEQSIEFVAKLQQLGVLISSLKAEYKTLERKWTRELKSAQKQSSKRKRKAGHRAPSGFVKPTRISDELAKFLEKPSGSEMARTEVTRDINKYIRTNNLQDKENGRKINPDNKLSALLKLKKTDELTYFNLQRYMSPHFAKATKDVVVVVAAGSTA